MRYILLFFTACLSLFTYAQDASVFKPDSIRKEIKALPIKGYIHVDGILNEKEWKQTIPSKKFTQVEPFQGNQPNHDTDIRVLYNQQYLYFSVFAKDSLGKKSIRATDFKRDFNFLAHDIVAFSFDGFNDKRNAMSIATNPFGVQRDLLSFDDIYYDVDWDGLWRVRTSRLDSGWVAEIAVPWQTLRYPKTNQKIQNWGFNVYRNRRLSNELTAFSPFPRSFTYLRMDYAGVLSNLQPPPPKPNIRIQPYLLNSFDNYSGSDFQNQTNQFSTKLGGELKWAFNSNDVLDITANTDFAQADADRQVNNTSRFSVFFPERRQFFLENASLFGVGISRNPDESGGNMRIQPFFSRRIGLDDAGNPIPIELGARFVHRSIKRNYGAILMRQKGLDTPVPTNFFVGRYSENIGDQNRIGGIVTVKDQPGGSNIVNSLDGFFRLGESHSMSAMLSHSASNNTGQQGYSAYAQYYYVSNQFKIWWTQSVVSKDYNPELGFVSRKDVIATTPGIFYWYRGKRLPFKKWLRAWEPSIFPEFYHQASTGKLIERSWTIYPAWLNLQSGAYFGYSITPTYQNLTEVFEPLGVKISTGEYNYVRHQIYASTDPSRVLNLQTIYNWGTYFNGSLISGDWTLQFVPIPHVSFSGRLNRNYFEKVGDLKETKTIDLYSLEGRFALNPRVQLIGFYQKNSENESHNYNIRLSWEYQPLSYIYLVFNQFAYQNSAFQNQIENHVISKISYLKQF